MTTSLAEVPTPAERPDVAELVTAIEEQANGEVSGDDLAAEIERFLREQ